MRPQLVCGILAFLALQAPVQAAECDEALRQRTQSDMRIPFDSFDQDPSKGWRALQHAGCVNEAAILIERYLAAEASRVRALRWHLAQMYATMGNSTKAIEQATASLNPLEADQHPKFHWADYVYATVAFLQQDRPAFEVRLASLRKATASHPENEKNLAVIEGLGRCFYLPYSQAYAKSCRDDK